MKAMNKRLLACFMAACMIFLSGCQLAKPEQAEHKDRLAGVLVTREHLDLFDIEAFAKDNAERLIKGGYVDTSEYQGRIYGELTRVGEHADGFGKYELSFPDVDGYFMADLLIEEDGESCWYSTSNGGLFGLSSGIKSTDEAEESTMEMSIAFWQEGTATMFCNPIYQTEDGRVYVESGSGLTADLSVGGEMTQTQTDSVTTTVNGESKTASTTVIVHAMFRRPTQELRLIQMDENNRIVKEDIYIEGTFPEGLVMEADTAYLLVQTTDGETAERTICTPKDQNAQYFVAQGDICLPQLVELKWSE